MDELRGMARGALGTARRRSPCGAAVLLGAWGVACAAPVARAQEVMPSATASPMHAATIVVGSKNFAESRLLAEIFAQLLESETPLRVERRLGLAGTQVCFAALRHGDIDLYPEYTGTGLVTLLGDSLRLDAGATFRHVREAFARRWDLKWLPALGFENAYEIAVRRDVARRYDLHTLSDLVAVAPRLRAGFGYEFAHRDDGLPGLERVYGLRFAEVRNIQQALKYQAAGAGEIDCLDVYTTDGRLLAYDLVVLEDDRDFFPPYEAAPLVRGTTLRRHPEIAAALQHLARSLPEDAMRRLNYRVEHDRAEIAAVAHDALVELGLLDATRTAAPTARARGLVATLWQDRRSLLRSTGQHLYLTAAGLLLGIAVAVPLGLWLERRRRLAEAVIRAVGTSQTIPSLALLAFMIPFFGIGARPAIVALWIYAIFPILRNTYTGLRDADPAVVDTARALGMTPGQILRLVRLPLAAPVIMAGIRTAAVLTVGTATLAAFVGAGGLGEPIVAGVQSVDTTVILSGAVPAAILAIAVDAALGSLEHWIRPSGLQPRGRNR